MSRFDAASNTAAIVRRGTFLLGALLVTASCATVSPDDLDAELERIRAELRQDLQEGDQAVEDRLSQRIAAIENRLNSLEGELGALSDEFHVTVERFETALRFNAPIHFAFDGDTVQDEHTQILDRFASVVREYYDDAIITVEGFTDPAGSADYNRALGERRAEAVKDYLAGVGIPDDRMRAVSYGEASERQIAPGAAGPSGDGWQNRRVAFVVDFIQSDMPPAVVVEADGESD